MTMQTVTETTVAEIERMGVEELLACVQHQRGRVEIDFGFGSPGFIQVKVSVPWGFPSSVTPRNAFEGTSRGDDGLPRLLMVAVRDCYQQAVAKATDADLAEAVSRFWRR